MQIAEQYENQLMNISHLGRRQRREGAAATAAGDAGAHEDTMTEVS